MGEGGFKVMSYSDRRMEAKRNRDFDLDEFMWWKKQGSRATSADEVIKIIKNLIVVKDHLNEIGDLTKEDGGGFIMRGEKRLEIIATVAEALDTMEELLRQIEIRRDVNKSKDVQLNLLRSLLIEMNDQHIGWAYSQGKNNCDYCE